MSKITEALHALIEHIKAIPTPEASAAALLAAKDAEIKTLTDKISTLQSDLAVALDVEDADPELIRQISDELNALVNDAQNAAQANAAAAPALAAAVAATPQAAVDEPAIAHDAEAGAQSAA